MNLRTIENGVHLKNPYVRFSLILVAGFALRVFLSQFLTYGPDFSVWIGWGSEISSVGFGNFYDKFWCDYMPGYLIILWILDHLHSAFPGLSVDILFKLPSNLADLGISILIFYSLRLITTNKNAMTASIVYLFNPASLANSTFWGQVDSFHALPILLSIYLGLRKKYILSGVFAALAFMIKPQSIAIFPLIGFLALRPLIRDRRKLTVRSFLPSFELAVTVVLTSIAVTLPFIWGGIDSVNSLFTEPFALIKERFDTAYGQYAYTSLNAFNFWGAFLMWENDDIKLLGVSYRMLGTLMFGTAYIFIAGLLVRFAILMKNDENGDYAYLMFQSVTLILFTLFLFVTRAHERHLLPMIVFFTIIAFRSWIFWYLYAIVSGVYTANMVYSYIQLTTEYKGIPADYPMYFIPGLFCLYLLAYIVIFWDFVVNTVNYKNSSEPQLLLTR